MLFDHLLPILPSQRQWQIDMLGAKCDFLQLNHPLRTPLTSDNMMRKLSGYMIMELDSGHSTECEYWDEALSAGHYSFGVANDDLHHPDRTAKIARRCTFIASPTDSWEDIERTLREGGFYAMRLPDYGDGDWDVKRKMNLAIPRIESIGLSDDNIYVSFSKRADSIRFTGQEQRLLHTAYQSDSANYTMSDKDSYVRITAYFPDGERIYTNAFARYDAQTMESPFDVEHHSVNILLTILYNILLLAIIIALGVASYKLIRRW
jgi:hypothetical protein